MTVDQEGLEQFAAGVDKAGGAITITLEQLRDWLYPGMPLTAVPTVASLDLRLAGLRATTYGDRSSSQVQVRRVGPPITAAEALKERQMEREREQAAGRTGLQPVPESAPTDRIPLADIATYPYPQLIMWPLFAPTGGFGQATPFGGALLRQAEGKLEIEVPAGQLTGFIYAVFGKERPGSGIGVNLEDLLEPAWLGVQRVLEDPRLLTGRAIREFATACPTVASLLIDQSTTVHGYELQAERLPDSNGEMCTCLSSFAPDLGGQVTLDYLRTAAGVANAAAHVYFEWAAFAPTQAGLQFTGAPPDTQGGITLSKVADVFEDVGRIAQGVKEILVLFGG